MKVVVNIGCIECGVSTAIVGVFEDAEAESIVDALSANAEAGWREGGQNSYEAFPLPVVGVIAEEYRQWMPNNPDKVAQDG